MREWEGGGCQEDGKEYLLVQITFFISGGSDGKELPTMQETQVWSLGMEDPLEKEMATHSSILAWRITWTEEHGMLLSMGSRKEDRTEWLTLTWSILPLLLGPFTPLLGSSFPSSYLGTQSYCNISGMPLNLQRPISSWFWESPMPWISLEKHTKCPIHSLFCTSSFNNILCWKWPNKIMDSLLFGN